MKPRYGTCPTSSSAELRAALAQYTARDRDQVRLDPDEAVRQTLMRLESAQMFLEGAPWRDFFHSRSRWSVDDPKAVSRTRIGR